MSVAPLLELSAGALRAQVAPQVGGSLARFDGEWRDAEKSGRVDWLRPASAAGLAARMPLAMSSFPLLPFCNRIRDGRASFEGREIRFPPNHPAESSPHPLHGIGWQRVWNVVDFDERAAMLSLDEPASAAWPWRFSAQQQYELDEKSLGVTVTLTNLDTAAMPAGIGHHPYFPHPAGTRLTTTTAAMWCTDAEVMPTRLETTDAVNRLHHGVTLSELNLDNNFTGWEHRALVEWPADAQGPRRRLLMEAHAPLDYFVLYCPRGYDHFCAEPVSQCTDWLNLLAQYGHGPLGGTRIEPGDTLTARFTLTPRWA